VYRLYRRGCRSYGSRGIQRGQKGLKLPGDGSIQGELGMDLKGLLLRLLKDHLKDASLAASFGIEDSQRLSLGH
jgi:hypothetical protein